MVGKWVHMVVVAGHLEIKSRDVTTIILMILFLSLLFDHLTGKAGS